ncbi:Protein of unknown function DUF541 [Ceraceosorus bombacis]|uniref:DUF541 domain-containing protein n=1 Tax=Ceraceosorus bombacis TaxID=401625 RepID=A0A0P1BK30_9BASI|nr:Protein of unknown function DUF541 [Ceraceosorus bombacis]
MPTTIRVSGQAQTTHKAELATLKLQIRYEHVSKEEASAQVRRTAAQLSAILSDLAPKDPNGAIALTAPVAAWSMESLTVTLPWYGIDDDEAKRKKRKSVAQAAVEATFRDIAKLSDIITTVSAIPHVSLQRVGWKLRKATRDSSQSDLRRRAAGNARVKAEDYAAALGCTASLKCVEVSDFNASPGWGAARTYGAPMMARAAVPGSQPQAPDIELKPEDIDVSIEVQTVWEAE